MPFFYYNFSMNFKRLLTSAFFVIPLFFVFSCTSTSEISKNSGSQDSSTADNALEKENDNPKISLVFAGDIMAHAVNYKYSDFSLIWQDVKPLISSGDLSFANIEAPVNDDMEWSSYPQFNMHSQYINAAIDAGFNVFSLANNHSNDWSLDGINATKSYFSLRNDVWACGLKSNMAEKLTCQVISKNGWKILFVAYTELLNSSDSSQWIDFYPPKKREALIDQLKKLYSINKPDIFVVSVHTSEEEYKQSISESHKKFYHQIIEECGVDVVWANHPHVYKKIEEVNVPRADGNPELNRTAFIMYANGNTISGQRSSPSLTKPHTDRDSTGDGLIVKLYFEKQSLDATGQLQDTNTKTTAAVKTAKVRKDIESLAEKTKAQRELTSTVVKLKKVEPHFITSYILPTGQIVVRLCDDDFIKSLTRSGLFTWADYVQLRKNLYEKHQGNSLWQ